MSAARPGAERRWTEPNPALDTLVGRLLDRIRAELREPSGVWGVEARRAVDRSWPSDLARGVLEYARDRGVLHPQRGRGGGPLEWNPVHQLRFILCEQLPARWLEDGVALFDVTYTVVSLARLAAEVLGCASAASPSGSVLQDALGEPELWDVVDLTVARMTDVDWRDASATSGGAQLRRFGSAAAIWDLLVLLQRDAILTRGTTVQDVVAVAAALSGTVTVLEPAAAGS